MKYDQGLTMAVRLPLAEKRKIIELRRYDH